MRYGEAPGFAYKPCRNSLSIVLAALILLCPSISFALDPSLDISQYAHTAWKVRDGFALGMIGPIAQTSDGYLWLGTEFGLLRFDGVRAVPWQPPVGQQLPSNYIRNLLVTRDGTLWIATDKGLASWKNSKLTNYSETAGQILLPLLQDHEGTVWFGTTAPGRLCAVQGAQVQCYGAGSLGQWVAHLYEDHKGNLWVAVASGVWRWDSVRPEHYALPGVEVNGIIESDSGELLLATSNGLKQIVGGRIRGYDLPGTTGQFRPTRFFRSSDGGLWVGTTGGLLRLHQGRTDTFGVADGLSSDGINTIFEDREGTVWVSTIAGLDRFRQYAIPTVSRNEGLSTSNTWSVQASLDGSIWIGTADGLNRWHNGYATVYGRGNARVQIRRRDERTPNTAGTITEITNSGLPGTARSLGQDDQGRLLASAGDGVFNLEGGRFVRVPGVPAERIWSIAGDGHGKVWISSDEGLFHVTPGDAVQHIPWSRLGHRGFGARTLLPDGSSSGVWLGFLEGGVFSFKDNQLGASYTAADGLGNGHVNDLRFGSGGTLWAATEGGLSLIKDGKISTLGSKNGLPCDEVHWSIEDDDHFVWLYMACGSVRIARPELDAWVNDPKRTVRTTVFDSSDGVRSVGVTGGYTPRVTKSPDGKIWFVTYDGVSVIDPRHLPHNHLPPPVHIEQITADGKTYDVSQGLKLPPLVRDLTINYTALSLVVPEKVRFRVKLEGQDKDWRELTDRRVHYTNLAPKHYRFLVKACNNSGVWNEEGAFVDFAIAPAYYQTNWFRTLVVAAVVALLSAIYRIRVGVLEQRQQLLEQNQQLLERHQGEITALNDRLMKAQEEERTRISGELHDSVLQKLTLLSLSLGIAKRQVPPDSEAKEKIRDVQKKLIEVGTDIRQLSHELHPAVLHESGLPVGLSAYCQEFSKIHGIPVSCEADATVRELSPGAALCIYRIVQEALGNVAKHSKANKVEVRLTRVDSRVCLSVSDDGVGFASNRAAESGGLGLINMRERVRQLQGTLELQSEPGHGTTVRAEIPFRPIA